LEDYLARKIRFRQQRIYELKIIIVFVLFFAVLLSGLIAVDLNKNYVIYGDSRLELLQIELLETDLYQVNILNSKFNLNLKYIKRDINNIKTFLKN
jgi:ABC-type microcin C transport system permease subunit YejE